MSKGAAATAANDNPLVRIPEELAERAERFGDRVAIDVDGIGQLTYRQWHDPADAAARGLAGTGGGKAAAGGLLIHTPAAVECAVGYVAAHRAGAAAVPINPRYARREIE